MSEKKEYIERVALIAFVSKVRKNLPKDSKDFFTRDEMLLNFQQYVDAQPAADVEPVVRGEWKADDRMFGVWNCSVCAETALCNGIEEEVKSAFCPHCGAKMNLN